jgi:hypothetical protein
MNRDRRIAILVVAVSLSCDGRSAIQVAGDGAADSGGAPGQPIAACVTLTVAFAGCDAERLAECEREYQSLPGAAQATIDADGVCFRNLGSVAPPLNTTWPATPATCAPALTLDEYWRHGACQQYNGAALGVITCAGTPVPCSSLSSQVDCQSQQGCSWDASSGACTGAAAGCAQYAGSYCATQKGCAATSLSFCGQAGQTPCFFTGTL